MGRKKPSLGDVKLKRRLFKSNFETCKIRHRLSDSKYRHNVQHLFELLKREVNGTKSRDSILSESLNKIKHFEDEIFDNESVQSMDDLKEFFSLLSLEETVWKQEKDVRKWWHRMEEFLEPRYVPRNCNAGDIISHPDNFSASLKTDLPTALIDISAFKTRTINETSKSSDVSTPCSYHELDAACEDEKHKNTEGKQKMLKNLWQLTFPKEDNLISFIESKTVNGSVNHDELKRNTYKPNSEVNSVLQTEIPDFFLESNPSTSFESSFQNIASLLNAGENSNESWSNEHKTEASKDFTSTERTSEEKQMSVINQPFFATELPLDNTVVGLQKLDSEQPNLLPASSVFFVL